MSLKNISNSENFKNFQIKKSKEKLPALKIGVTTNFLYPDPERRFFPVKTLCYLENDMANYLARKAVLPILIPDLQEDRLYPFLEEMDAFVFQGGSDVCPLNYGEDFLDKNRWPGDPRRDEYELRIMDFAFKNKKPVLGICRGAQIINVYFKGKLYQDLETQIPNCGKHRDQYLYDRVHHEAGLLPGGALEQIYPPELFQSGKKVLINSVHHQGIKVLGKGLKAEAVSLPDQIIEAYSYENLQENFVLAFQWHPEFHHTLAKEGKSPLDPEPICDFFLDRVVQEVQNK